MTEWGEAISVDGKRPGWLRDEEKIEWVKERNDGWRGPCAAEGHNWEGTRAYPTPTSHIRLPATHPYYLVQRYNAEHGTSFVYWPGGDGAPEDWDQGDVLRYDGYVGSQDNPNGYTWRRGYDHKSGVDPADIIGIRRKRTAAAQPGMVQVRRMTEVEAREWADKLADQLPNKMEMASHSWSRRWDAYRDIIPQVIAALGTILPEPTEAERIAAKTGIDLATVTAVLDAREGD